MGRHRAGQNIQEHSQHSVRFLTKSTCMLSTQVDTVTSSRLNNTPPIGAPKATETPAAAAADKTYNIRFKISNSTATFLHSITFSEGILGVPTHC